MTIWMIKGESNDWCGISEEFVVESDITDDEELLSEVLGRFGNEMDEALYEFYGGDEEDEDFINSDDASFSYSAEVWTEEVFGDHKCESYIQLGKL